MCLQAHKREDHFPYYLWSAHQILSNEMPHLWKQGFSKTFHFVFFPLTISITPQNTSTAMAETKHRRKTKKLSVFSAKEYSWLTLGKMPLLLVDPCIDGASCYTYCGHVNRSCGFIHDENATFADKGSGQTEELPLPYTEVLSSFCDHCICNKTSYFECRTTEMLYVHTISQEKSL